MHKYDEESSAGTTVEITSPDIDSNKTPVSISITNTTDLRIDTTDLSNSTSSAKLEFENKDLNQTVSPQTETTEQPMLNKGTEIPAMNGSKSVIAENSCAGCSNHTVNPITGTFFFVENPKIDNWSDLRPTNRKHFFLN